ncbi:MAG: 3-oxoadipate enol-lactonase [Gammaproteobacteria bacterium]|nr:3-oxoadipate enol-lactonase [Gammaproteobacteria bacterium]MDH3448750.1 3-oxoadipate enol-lactonase [Gammaproteobacteria bacterium]
MDMIELGEVTLHYRVDGDADGATIVFANSLGTDFRLWDKILPRLPAGLRIVRYDTRGHGLSSCPGGDYTMDELVDECAHLLQALGVRDCLFVGLSIGGIIAQGLASRYPELLRAMVISNTAARIGTAELWHQRIDALHNGGIESIADNIMQRWFARSFHREHSLELLAWRNMLTRTPLNGYIGCCAAIAATDYSASSAALTLPTLAIAGNEDGSVPPEAVRATADLIAGARYAQIDDSGHLPCVEKPDEYARLLNDFIRETGHA